VYGHKRKDRLKGFDDFQHSTEFFDIFGERTGKLGWVDVAPVVLVFTECYLHADRCWSDC
jgi:hypothetical protein